MSEEFTYGVRGLEPSKDGRENARLFINSNQGVLAAISTSETAMQLRDYVIAALEVPRDKGEPLAPLSRFESAVLAEAIDRWNKAHPLDKSNE